jgi:predicted ATPase
VGTALETLYSDQLDQVAVRLARHFQDAGNVNKAIDYRLRAGESARHLSAEEEALRHFRLGLVLVDDLPEGPDRAQRELSLVLSLGRTLTATLGSAAPAVGESFGRARELCRQLGLTPELYPQELQAQAGV